MEEEYKIYKKGDAPQGENTVPCAKKVCGIFHQQCII